jgi:hypothetical protein
MDATANLVSAPVPVIDVVEKLASKIDELAGEWRELLTPVNELAEETIAGELQVQILSLLKDVDDSLATAHAHSEATAPLLAEYRTKPTRAGADRIRAGVHATADALTRAHISCAERAGSISALMLTRIPGAPAVSEEDPSTNETDSDSSGRDDADEAFVEVYNGLGRFLETVRQLAVPYRRAAAWLEVSPALAATAELTQHLARARDDCQECRERVKVLGSYIDSDIDQEAVPIRVPKGETRERLVGRLSNALERCRSELKGLFGMLDEIVSGANMIENHEDPIERLEQICADDVPMAVSSFATYVAAEIKVVPRLVRELRPLAESLVGLEDALYAARGTLFDDRVVLRQPETYADAFDRLRALLPALDAIDPEAPLTVINPTKQRAPKEPTRGARRTDGGVTFAEQLTSTREFSPKENTPVRKAPAPPGTTPVPTASRTQRRPVKSALKHTEQAPPGTGADGAGQDPDWVPLSVLDVPRGISYLRKKITKKVRRFFRRRRR